MNDVASLIIIIIIIIGSTTLGGPWPHLFFRFCINFLRRGLLARPTPTLEAQDIPFVWVITLDLSGMEGPTRTYATSSLALRIV
jgi:hypothetical protein